MDQKRGGRTPCWSHCDHPSARSRSERTDVLALYLTTGIWVDEYWAYDHDLPNCCSCASHLVYGKTLRSYRCSIRVPRVASSQYAGWSTAYASAIAAAGDDKVVFARHSSSPGSLGPGRRSGAYADH